VKRQSKRQRVRDGQHERRRLEGICGHRVQGHRDRVQIFGPLTVAVVRDQPNLARSQELALEVEG
jgi:hypothetical protein